MKITKGKLRQIIREELSRLSEKLRHYPEDCEEMDQPCPEDFDPENPGAYRGGGEEVGYVLDSPRGKWRYNYDYTDGQGNVQGEIYITLHPGDPGVSREKPIVLKPGHPEYNATRSKLSALIQSDRYEGRWTRDPHPSLPGLSPAEA